MNSNIRKTVLVTVLVTLGLMCSLGVASADDYYVYANFYGPTDPVYMQGQGVGGYENNLYVQRGTYYCDVYEVTIPPGSDPNMHPDNPNATGPMAPRNLTLVESYKISDDIGTQSQSQNEFYVDDSGIYYGAYTGVYRWNRNANGTFGSYVGKVVGPGLSGAQTLAYDSTNDVWYTGHWNRSIYSFRPGIDTSWQYEFTYPNYAGSHHDGMEFVNGYLWISDMTSNVIGQWQNATGWVEVNRFNYTNPVDDDVEGMGFGPLGHFWATGWNRLYELGGGALQIALEGIPDQCVLAGEAFETFDLDNYTAGVPPFNWSYTGNTNLVVNIDADNVATITYLDGWNGSETITFTVTDSAGNTASDDATFTVDPVPVVGDIEDQTAPFETFDLDDYLSEIDPSLVTWSASDPGGNWTVIIDSGNVVTVTAPDGATDPVTITFTATATACGGDVNDSDDATFTPNQPPNVTGAYPSIDCLWPPNHKFVGVTIEGVTDPDGDNVTITITNITSDEPTASIDGAGGANHAPDADPECIGTDTASIRAERSGNEDGRVYEITFLASDGIGEPVEGTVQVKVPHDQSGDCVSIDSGQNYDATEMN